MKKLLIPVCLAAFLNLATSCGGGNESSSNGDSSNASMSSSDSTTSTSATNVDTNRNNNESNDTSKMTASTNNAPDGDFMLDAASGGMMEVTLGQTAATNAASPRVKEFGQMMVKDHTKANTELKALAAKKNVTLPAAPAQKQQSHIDDLTPKKGADFDKDYVDMMVDDHKEDISKFQDEAKNGKDPDVKAFAAKTLPVLQKHLAAIQAVQKGMKK